MIVPAVRRASRAEGDRLVKGIVLRSLLFAAASTFASSTSAQVGAAVSIFTDDRFRGYSLSDGRPVGVLDLSYDAPDGFYGALSGTLVATRHDGIQPLGMLLNGGYAKRLSSTWSLDLGLTHANYSRYSSGTPGRSYTEGYAGLTGKLLSARIHVSPDYLSSGPWSLYSEVDGHVSPGAKWHFTAHAGLLVPLRGRDASETYRPEFDWKLGVARDFGPVTANVSWAGTHRREEVYPYRSHATRGLVFGLTYAL